MIIAELACLLLSACGGASPDPLSAGAPSFSSTAPALLALAQVAPVESPSAAVLAAVDNANVAPATTLAAGTAYAATPELARVESPIAGGLPGIDAISAVPTTEPPAPVQTLALDRPAGLAVLSPAAPAAAGTSAPTLTTEDFFVALDARLSLADQSWQGLNCYGGYPQLRQLPAQGVVGTPAHDGETLRFGRTSDPLAPQRAAFVVRTTATDPLTADAHRCELVAYPAPATALPMRETFWYAFRIMVWDGAESNGDDQLLTQWRTSGLNPFWGLYMRDGKLRIEIRHDNSAAASKGTEVLRTPWVDSARAKREWATFVVQARISPSQDDNPMLRVWRNGVQIVNQTLPIGYNVADLPHAKIGFYQWTQFNRWDSTVPVRTIFFSRAGLLKDPAGRRTEAELRAWANGQ